MCMNSVVLNSCCRCGSLTFDVNLKFNTRVAEDVIISTIRNAILHKRLGELRINVSSIIGIPPVPLPTTTKPLKTTPKPESKFPLFLFVSEDSENVTCTYLWSRALLL